MKRAILQDILKRCHHQLHLGTHPQKDNFIHWTFLIRNGRIISSGVNRPVEPPRCFGYHTELCREGTPFPPKNGVPVPLIPKLHSELDAYRRCREDFRGCIAVNVRLNKTGQERISMPCVTCRKLLWVNQCKKVFFTTELGWGELCIS